MSWTSSSRTMPRIASCMSAMSPSRVAGASELPLGRACSGAAIRGRLLGVDRFLPNDQVGAPELEQRVLNASRGRGLCPSLQVLSDRARVDAADSADASDLVG